MHHEINALQTNEGQKDQDDGQGGPQDEDEENSQARSQSPNVLLMQPISPKAAFIANPTQTGAWVDVTGSTLFRTACHHAMLQFVQEMPSGGDPSKQWDAFAQLLGARRFVEILSTLADKQEISTKPSPPTLNYNSKQ